MNAAQRMAKSLIWKPAKLRLISKSDHALARLIRRHGQNAKVKDVIKAEAKQ